MSENEKNSENTKGMVLTIAMIFLVGYLFFMVTGQKKYRSEIITFSQKIIVKDVTYFGNNTTQAEFDVVKNGHVISTSILVHKLVTKGERKTYIEYKTKDFLGKETTEEPDLR